MKRREPGNARYWLTRMASKRTGYPLATLAHYGPDDTRASKVVVGIIVSDRNPDPTELRKWFSDASDARTDQTITAELLAFLKERGVQRIVTLDRIIGCPHEEGIDYPEGETCPQCPFWADVDRFTGERLSKASSRASEKPSCGLCGKQASLTRTECCGNWICDDEEGYVAFSYSRNSCSRNHDRYTLCSSHHNEGHAGDWKTCEKCRTVFETEMYVWYGTNEYNFERLSNPPKYEPTCCRKCGKVIRLGEDGYMQDSEGYSCSRCAARR